MHVRRKVTNRLLNIIKETSKQHLADLTLIWGVNDELKKYGVTIKWTFTKDVFRVKSETLQVKGFCKECYIKQDSTLKTSFICE
jgi:hypothetical protein